MFSTVYAAVAGHRRRYYAIHPHLRRVLSQPVISIGNLAVGGRAKTPLAALVAAGLRDLGERPAILSRGYGRRDAADGVVVVRDRHGIRADLDRAGDQPLMLPRQLDGVAVLASSSRYLARRLAEHHFGCTVHVLDYGFQHFALHRDADILVVDPQDLERPDTLPDTRADVARITGAARASGARLILTTEKDLVRLLPFRPFTVPVAYAPMTLEIDRPAALDEWLLQMCREARGTRPGTTRSPRNTAPDPPEQGPRNTAPAH